MSSPNVGRWMYDCGVIEDEYRDIEEWILRSGAGPAIGVLRRHFPRWRRFLLAEGVDRVSRGDAKANNLMVLLINGTALRGYQDQRALHNIRNILSRQGAPTFSKRGWKN
jgi:hypothetical protein